MLITCSQHHATPSLEVSLRLAGAEGCVQVTARFAILLPLDTLRYPVLEDVCTCASAPNTTPVLPGCPMHYICIPLHLCMPSPCLMRLPSPQHMRLPLLHHVHHHHIRASTTTTVQMSASGMVASDAGPTACPCRANCMQHTCLRAPPDPPTLSLNHLNNLCLTSYCLHAPPLPSER